MVFPNVAAYRIQNSNQAEFTPLERRNFIHLLWHYAFKLEWNMLTMQNGFSFYDLYSFLTYIRVFTLQQI